MGEGQELWHDQRGPVELTAYRVSESIEEVEAVVTFRVTLRYASKEKEHMIPVLDFDEEMKRRAVYELDRMIDGKIADLHQQIRDTGWLPKPVKMATVKIINWNITEAPAEITIDVPIMRKDGDQYTCEMPDGKYHVFHRGQIVKIFIKQTSKEDGAIEMFYDPYCSPGYMVFQAVSRANNEQHPVFFRNRGYKVFAFPGDTNADVIARLQKAE
jgi:hypothetical protein